MDKSSSKQNLHSISPFSSWIWIGSLFSLVQKYNLHPANISMVSLYIQSYKKKCMYRLQKQKQISLRLCKVFKVSRMKLFFALCVKFTLTFVHYIFFLLIFV